ncbi:hypothetical protein CPC08DRAFT_468870 [Agrocybe pediades]|nr:hypothetical protein CPC08DRAFT_468870 [Agrocybe pediades]
MHPSSLGRGVSGGQSSLNPQASNNTHGSNNHPRSPSGNVVQGGPQAAQQSSHPDNTTANDLWYLTAQSGSVNNSKPIASATSSSSASMIGPTSTFYNPEENANQPLHTEQGQYQQWLDNCRDNQQQQPQQLGYDSYRQGPAPQLNAQNPYRSYLQGAYRPSRQTTHYTGSNAGTVTQAPGGSLVTSGQISSYQTQNDAYSPFYEALSLNPSLTTTPEHYSTPEPANQSYTASPNPMYHQQQQPLYNQQHQQPNMTPNAEPNQSTSAQTGQFLRPQPAQYLQRNQPEQGSRVSSNTYPTAPSSHSVSPPANVWGNETNYPQFGLLDSQPRTAPSRTSAAPFGKRPAVNAAETKSFNNNVSGPAATTSAAPAAASSSQTSLKRKRVRKNDMPEGKFSQEGYGGQDSDSDSYDDEDDGTGLGMTGGIGVGLGGLGVVGKGGKRNNRARL